MGQRQSRWRKRECFFAAHEGQRYVFRTGDSLGKRGNPLRLGSGNEE